MFKPVLAGLAAAIAVPALAWAGPGDFAPGPVIEEFGPVAPVEGALPIPEGTEFRVSFDTKDQTAEGELNSKLTAAARFLNMQAAAGVPVENIHLAIVVHGTAVHDVTRDSAGANANICVNNKCTSISFCKRPRRCQRWHTCLQWLSDRFAERNRDTGGGRI